MDDCGGDDDRNNNYCYNGWVDFSTQTNMFERESPATPVTQARASIEVADDEVRLEGIAVEGALCYKGQQSFSDTEESSSTCFQQLRNGVSPTLEASRFADRDVEEDHGIGRSPGNPVKSSTPTKDAYHGATTVPNDPHPFLEYPLLYYLLKRFPIILKKSKFIYRMRWRLSYPLQHRVPLSTGLHATWGELLLLAPFITYLLTSLVYTCVIPSVPASGQVARVGLIASMFLAQRNSLWTLLVGIPVNRTVFYHKLAGYFSGLAGLLHTGSFYLDPTYSFRYRGSAMSGAFADQMNCSGSLLLLCIVGIVVTSLPRIRRGFFEAFFYLHYMFVCGLVVSAWFHSGYLVPLMAALTWGVDLLLRHVVLQRTLNPKVARLRTIGSTVVEVSFLKTAEFSYNPGQFVYLTVPDITMWQSHPFSISSAPCQDVVTFHVRVLGNWTTALFDLAQKQSAVRVHVDGPYGSLAVDLMGDRKYKSVVLISGGIGVAPMQSISDQLLYEHSQGFRELRRLKYVWVERDPIFMENVRTRPANRSSGIAGHNNLAELLLASFPPSTEEEDEEEDAECLSMLDDGSACETPTNSSTCSEQPESSSSSSCTVDICVYLTGTPKTQRCIPPFACLGRPDIPDIFYGARKEALEAGEKKIAVCVAAPAQLKLIVQKACIFFSDDHVRFDIHSESGEGFM